MINVILFDLFGTVFDIDAAPYCIDREELDHYAEVINAPEYRPLELSDDGWNHVKAFPDACGGISILHRDYIVGTLSNCPLPLAIKLSKRALIDWDVVIPMELLGMYKPNPAVYVAAAKLFDCAPQSILLVTAKQEAFGELEAAEAAGMQTQVIRHPGAPSTITELVAGIRAR